MRVYGGKFKSRLDEIVYGWDADEFHSNENTGASIQLFHLNPSMKIRKEEFQEGINKEYEGEMAEFTEEEKTLIEESVSVTLWENSRGEVISDWYKSKTKAQRDVRAIWNRWEGK